MQRRSSIPAVAPFLLACLALATEPAHALEGVAARSPLIQPFFTVDPNSPEVQSGWCRAGDLLIPPGPGAPTIVISGQHLGLIDTNDHIDALARGDSMFDVGDTFALLFSVDRSARGAVGPDLTLVARGYPFNVMDQADKAQAAGDGFMGLLLYTRLGPIPPPGEGESAGDGAGASHAENSTLVLNHGDAGGIDFNVTPRDVSPETFISTDAPLGCVSAATGVRSRDQQGAGDPHALREVYYSLSALSPSLAHMPGDGSPADIFVDNSLHSPLGTSLYARHDMLGLLPEDDVDALIVFDDGDQVFVPGLDQIIFSLAPGSPSLGEFFGPADLFSTSGWGIFHLYAGAERMGLRFEDNLDLLDLVPCDDILSCVDDWAIGFVARCNGDTDGDGDVDIVDLNRYIDGFGACVGDDNYSREADEDGNGCIGVHDLSSVLIHFGAGCGG